MSEDTTKDISSKYDTGPTIETVLETIQELRSEMRKGFTDIQRQLAGFELRFDKLDDKIDVLNGDVLNLRADARRDRRGLGDAATKQDEGTPASDTP